MRADKAAFVRCVAEKILTYALGRGLEDYDRRAVNAIVRATNAADDRFSALFIEIIKSDPFQKRTTPEN